MLLERARNERAVDIRMYDACCAAVSRRGADAKCHRIGAAALGVESLLQALVVAIAPSQVDPLVAAFRWIYRAVERIREKRDVSTAQGDCRPAAEPVAPFPYKLPEPPAIGVSKSPLVKVDA